jgi:ferrochelatase
MRLGVVLFNLGGPDTPEAVEPFLFNLFHDPAIIRVPQPFRWALAKLISRRRAPVAREIYAEMGGGSPIVAETEMQARALGVALSARGIEAKTVIAMRYWHPRAEAAAVALKDWAPDRIVLLPLYPQYSTTTSASSLKEWHEAAARAGLEAPATTVCCYPRETGFIAAQAAAIRAALDDIPQGVPTRVLFSAHGLPERVIEAGDPYQWQIERTAEAIVRALNIDGLDWRITYQSRVGPLKWIGPATDDEIIAAGREGRALAVAPIAFVSEHSETLVELDIEYADLARENGVPHYARAATVRTAPDFIAGLAGLVADAAARPAGTICADGGARACPASFRGCPCPASG